MNEQQKKSVTIVFQRFRSLDARSKFNIFCGKYVFKIGKINNLKDERGFN